MSLNNVQKKQTETTYSLMSESAVTFPPSAGSLVEVHVEAAGRWWTRASLCSVIPAEMLVSGAAGWHLLPETALKTNMTADSKLLTHHSADMKARKSPCEMTRSLLKKKPKMNKKPQNKKNKQTTGPLSLLFCHPADGGCEYQWAFSRADMCVCVGWKVNWGQSAPADKQKMYMCVCVKDWALGKKKKDEKMDVWLLLPVWLVFNGCKLGALSEETFHE